MGRRKEVWSKQPVRLVQDSLGLVQIWTNHIGSGLVQGIYHACREDAKVMEKSWRKSDYKMNIPNSWGMTSWKISAVKCDSILPEWPLIPWTGNNINMDAFVLAHLPEDGIRLYWHSKGANCPWPERMRGLCCLPWGRDVCAAWVVSARTGDACTSLPYYPPIKWYSFHLFK